MSLFPNPKNVQATRPSIKATKAAEVVMLDTRPRRAAQSRSAATCAPREGLAGRIYDGANSLSISAGGYLTQILPLGIRGVPPVLRLCQASLMPRCFAWESV